MKATAAMNAATTRWCATAPASNATPAARRAGAHDELRRTVVSNNWTDGKIAELAEGLRKFAGQTNASMLDVPELIEKLSQAPPNLRMSIIPALDSSLPFAAAEAEPDKRRIRVRYKTLTALNQNDPVARAIILEEY